MALTINHQTNDISATTAPTTIDGKPLGMVLLAEGNTAGSTAYNFVVPSGINATTFFFTINLAPSAITSNYLQYFRLLYNGGASVITSSTYSSRVTNAVATSTTASSVYSRYYTGTLMTINTNTAITNWITINMPPEADRFHLISSGGAFGTSPDSYTIGRCFDTTVNDVCGFQPIWNSAQSSARMDFKIYANVEV